MRGPGLGSERRRRRLIETIRGHRISGYEIGRRLAGPAAADLVSRTRWKVAVSEQARRRHSARDRGRD
jgi:hypothetical protein